MEYNINDLLDTYDFNSNFFKEVGSNLLLTNKEIEILDKYNINYNDCQSLKELIFKIDTILTVEDIEELETIAEAIATRDYYQNTNK